MTVPERIGFNPVTGKLLQTANRRLSTCPNVQCCFNYTGNLTAYVSATSDFSGGTQNLGCDKIALTRSALAGGGWKWTGNAHSSVWEDCIFEDTFELEVQCNDGFARDACTSAMDAEVENTGIAVTQCCCNPPCIITSWVADGSTSPIEMVEDIESGTGQNECSPVRWDGATIVSFGVWIFGLDENGQFCCHPDTCPPFEDYSSGPCNGEETLCDEFTTCARCTTNKAGESTWRIEGTGYGNACCKFLSNIHSIAWDGSGCGWDYDDNTCNERADWEINVMITITATDILATVTFEKSGEASFSIDYAYSSNIGSPSISPPINCESEWHLAYTSQTGDTDSDPCVSTNWNETVFVWNPRASDTT